MNHPHTSRKLALAVAVASAVFLAGCDTSNEKVQATPPSETQSFVPGVAPRFNPFASDVPFNIDLLFNGTTDGTALVNQADNPVVSALNDLDGFSTTAYFDIAFDGSIDPDSVVAKGGPGAGQNVYLIPLDTGSNEVLEISSIVGPDAAAASAFTFSKVSASVVSLDGGTNNVLRVAPEEPLLPGKKYLVVLTNGITDAGGNATTPSSSYFAIKDTTNTSLNAALMPLRTAINSAWEAVAGGFIQAVSSGAITSDAFKESIILTYSFTTTDPNKPLLAMAAPRAALIAGGADPGDVALLEAGGFLPTPKERPLSVSAATAVDLNVLSGGALAADTGFLYTGYIELPAYQPVANPAAGFDPTFLGRNWTADLTLAGAISQTVPQDSDGSYNVTYRYPFAEEQGVEAVPLQVTLPDPDVVPSFAGGATCAQWQASSGNPGYPVVIYLHGITSDRTSVVALAHALAGQCVATVAIDLPVHGVAATSPYKDSLNIERAPFAALYAAAEPRERHFNIYSNNNVPASMDFTAGTGGSGDWFINLGRLQNTRDNLRQGVMDMLNLNASLSAVAELDLDGDADPGTPLFDLSKVYVVGVSLGGSVGAVFTAINQQAIAADAAVGLTANLNPIAGFVASTPASQLAQVLINSQVFGPQIVAGLAASGVNQGTSDFEKFAYAAQATVDSGDPVNFAKSLDTVGVPTLIQQIVGGGDATALGDTKTYTADKVVPNSVAGIPLVGTTPFATLAGADQLSPGATVDISATNGLVNLTIGHHASLLRPSEDGVTPQTNGELLATSELQTQVVSFVLSGLAAGSTVAVGTAGGGNAAGFVQPPTP